MPNQQPNLGGQFNQSLQSIGSPSQKPKFKLKYILLVIILILAVLVVGGVIAFILLDGTGHDSDEQSNIIILRSMNQLRNTAEIILSSDGNYNNVNCATGTEGVPTLCSDITVNGANFNIFKPTAPSASYCAEVKMNNGGNWYCVDSELRSRMYKTNPVCSSTVFSCE